MPLGQLTFDLSFGPMARPPRKNRLGEHVVEDLVTYAPALFERAQDPPLGEGREHGLHDIDRNLAEVREVGNLMSDLRPRWGDQVVKKPGSNVLLFGRQLGHRPLEVLLDNVAGTAELLQGVDP